MDNKKEINILQKPSLKDHISNNKLGLLITILAFLIPILMVLGVLPRNEYSILLLCFICIYIIACSGLDILFGYTGQMSLGHAGFYAIGAYVSALLSLQNSQYGTEAWFGFSLPPFFSMFVAALLAAIIAALLAIPATKLVYHFLALLTIAFGMLMFLVISMFPKITNGYSGLINIPQISFFGFTLNNNIRYYFYSLIMVIVFLFLKQRIINSRVGRALIAIRDNQLAANGCGVNVQKYKIISFALSAFFTAYAGAMYAHLVTFISPESFQYAQSVLFLTMLVFGGNGNLWGPV